MATKLKAVPTPDIKDIIKRLPQEFLMCRSFGHQWNPYTVYKRGSEFESVLECGRCNGYRHQFISSVGKVNSAYYTYEPGYLIAGWGTMTVSERQQIRLAAVTMMWNQGESVAV